MHTHRSIRALLRSRILPGRRRHSIMLFPLPDPRLDIRTKYVCHWKPSVKTRTNETNRLAIPPPRPKLPLPPQCSPLLLPPPLLHRASPSTNAQTLPLRRPPHPRPACQPLFCHSRIHKPRVLLRCHYTRRHARQHVLRVDRFLHHTRRSRMCSLGFPAELMALRTHRVRCSAREKIHVG